MESIKFPEMTRTYAKSQPQYKTLHVHEMEIQESGNGVKCYTAKYQLSDLEIAQIVKTRCLYSVQIGNVLHPSSCRSESPFFGVAVPYYTDEDGLITASVKDHSGTHHKFRSRDPSALIDTIMNKFSDITSAEHLCFIEQSSLSIGPEGLEGL
jgi:hypothetical protein